MDGREDRRPRANDDPGLAHRDPLALVAAFRIRERRVENGDPPAEASPEPAHGLWRQRDLGHEHDGPAIPRERGSARLEVDLGLSASGRAVQEQMTSPGVQRSDDRAIASR